MLKCEEPHNAQSDLDLACEYYFPGLVQSIDQLTSSENADGKAAEAPNEALKTQSPELPNLPRSDSYSPLELAADAMKGICFSKVVYPPYQASTNCSIALNILGILWAGRGQSHKSFQYLLAANTLYLRIRDSQDFRQAANLLVTATIADDIENIYTHNCFYLAQAYGHIGDSTLSSKYCHLTLQRQFIHSLQPLFKSYTAGSLTSLSSDGISTFAGKLKVALDWVRNNNMFYSQILKQYFIWLHMNKNFLIG